MKHSILLTVFDREAEVLLRTLKCLRECDLADTEVVVVNDGSGMSYEWARDYVRSNFERGVWHDMEPYEAWRAANGMNNPARAFNKALMLAEGETVVAMSSDVMVPPRTMARMKKIKTSEMLWTPFVEDTHGEQPLLGHYCGPKRLFPMPWFLAMSREHVLEVGGWDETYLNGVNYEDNDFVGRVALRTGGFMGDWAYKVFHQGHVQPAANMADDEIRAATARNKEWTKEKWGGIPFDSEFTPFDVSRRMHPSGNPVHVCTARPEKLARAVEMTTGLVKDKGVADAVSR